MFISYCNQCIFQKSIDYIIEEDNQYEIRERMRFVLNVVFTKHILAQVERDLHRSKRWGSKRLKRFREEALEGLKTDKKVVNIKIYQKREYRDKKKFQFSKNEWTANQVKNLDVRKTGIRYHYTSIEHNEKIRSEYDKLEIRVLKMSINYTYNIF